MQAIADRAYHILVIAFVATTVIEGYRRKRGALGGVLGL